MDRKRRSDRSTSSSAHVESQHVERAWVLGLPRGANGRTLHADLGAASRNGFQRFGGCLWSDLLLRRHGTREQFSRERLLERSSGKYSVNYAAPPSVRYSTLTVQSGPAQAHDLAIAGSCCHI